MEERLFDFDAAVDAVMTPSPGTPGEGWRGCRPSPGRRHTFTPSTGTPGEGWGGGAWLRAKAFTIVELLVVIGIIGVLMAILLPTLSSARRSARMVNEMAASRELIQAYTIYSVEQKALIPGYINTTAPEFQHLVVSDVYGNTLDAQAADRWPWRLASYIKYGLKGSILVNEMEPLAERKNWDAILYPAPDWAYAVSLYPSFGLNMLNLGGDLYHGSGNQQGWIQKPAQAKQASRLIVFASSHFSAATSGYFSIEPPVLLTTTIYRGNPVVNTSGWASVKDYSNVYAPGQWGYIDPRWKGKAVVAFLDGHSDLLSLREMCDMTRWSNAAQLAGNPNLGRPTNDPNWVP